MMDPPPPRLPRVFSTPPSREYYFREGCHILEWLNDPADPELSIARARVAAGTRTRRHRLEGTTERYLILSGEGRVFLGDDETGQPVGPGEVVWIPAGTDQSIEALGREELVFLALCTPRFEERHYVATE
jgi:mannose-6-phosphate isomerase-like protein (cupin superfamily)